MSNSRQVRVDHSREGSQVVKDLVVLRASTSSLGRAKEAKGQIPSEMSSKNSRNSSLGAKGEEMVAEGLLSRQAKARI
jgi:hypothetical protein